MLKFVNQIAEHFPHKKIATLAYTYTRKAPLYTKPASNVVIQMCAIETARQGINFLSLLQIFMLHLERIW